MGICKIDNEMNNKYNTLIKRKRKFFDFLILTVPAMLFH
jgi:hypothetical protein